MSHGNIIPNASGSLQKTSVREDNGKTDRVLCDRVIVDKLPEMQ